MAGATKLAHQLPRPADAQHARGPASHTRARGPEGTRPAQAQANRSAQRATQHERPIRADGPARQGNSAGSPGVGSGPAKRPEAGPSGRTRPNAALRRPI